MSNGTVWHTMLIIYRTIMMFIVSVIDNLFKLMVRRWNR